uniref:Uncharacterized protein n=1 Tax=Heterorhabditis bacteriophora TaxID=37862 RepID=A0A1I7WE80_HETBA
MHYHGNKLNSKLVNISCLSL